MDYTTAIEERTSVRTFAERTLTENHINLVKDIINKSAQAPDFLDCEVSLKFIDLQSSGVSRSSRLGTYGIIKNPQGFIAAVCSNDEYSMLKTGFVLEDAVLRLSEAGIGTCWLGGTFKRKSFMEAAECRGDNFIPVISPVGYPAERKSMADKMVRGVARSHTRKNWESLFFSADFNSPLEKETSAELSGPLQMVQLAPSASNKQPWLLLVSEDKKDVHFYLDENPGYNKSIGYSIQHIDMGIAMCHFERGCTDLGLSGNWNSNNPLLPMPRDNVKYISTFSLI